VSATGVAVALQLPNPAASVALSVASVVVSVLTSAALVIRRSLTIANDPGSRFVPSSFSESYRGQDVGFVDEAGEV
jgi:hypothetical protein